MKHIPSFDNFLNEAEVASKTVTKVVSVSFDIDWNENIGKVEDSFTLAFSPDSTGIYTIGKDIEKFIGIPEADVVRDVKAGKEKPEDAIIDGIFNVMNGGADIFFWNNGTRLSGTAEQNGIWPAVLEQISHEAGVHLTRLILTRAILKKKGIKIENGDWVNEPWPSMGDDSKVDLIDEEAFATAAGLVVQTVTPHFLEMASAYIPQLSAASKI